MSGIMKRHTISELKRSNSHESIPLETISTSIHYKRRDQNNDGDPVPQDDSVLILTEEKRVVSSPFTSVASALACAIHGLTPDRKDLNLGNKEQSSQDSIQLISDISYILGERRVKISEGVIYRSADRKNYYEGILLITNYRLIFLNQSPSSSQDQKKLVDVPLMSIGQIKKIGGQTRRNINDRAPYGIEIQCKNFCHFFFGIDRENYQRRNLVDRLIRVIFPFSIEKPDLNKPEQFFQTFFAYHHKRAVCPNEIDSGWNLYNPIEDFVRMGIRKKGDYLWKIDEEINENYRSCETYPNVIVIPANFPVDRLAGVFEFRSRRRIPILSWFCKRNYATITRSSQPLVGINRKSYDDIDYLQEIANTNVKKDSRLLILDARPKVNAIANKASGGGYEDYPQFDLEFHNIENIHIMRESLNKLLSGVRMNSPNESDLHQWLSHIDMILTSSQRIVSAVHDESRSVLVHCSDGWDRTAQLTSLSMLMLDGYYRTFEGFLKLIEKEWISLGHKFLSRLGHADKDCTEQSPVFLQFLDCTFQLIKIFDTSFEFNEKLLITIADALYSCQYGTFLLSSEKQRKEMKIAEYTLSLWTSILESRSSFINTAYQIDSSNLILNEPIPLARLKFWDTYFYRFLPDYPTSSFNNSIKRNIALIPLQEKFKIISSIELIHDENLFKRFRPLSIQLSGSFDENSLKTTVLSTKPSF